MAERLSADHVTEAPKPTHSVSPVAIGEKLPRRNEDNLARALELKQEGNEFFKAGEWRKAMRKYHHGLLHARGILESVQIPGLEHVMRPGPTPEEKAAAQELTVSMSNNLAMCMMKIQDWDKVIQYTSKVLESDPSNVKALFRRGVARLNLNSLEQAREDLKQAQELDPKDEGIKKQLLLLEHRAKQYEKREKKLYSAMFEQKS